MNDIVDGELAATFEESFRRSEALRARFATHPSRYRVLTGDRPTGGLHIGHYFGSLKTRLELQALGVETYVVIADYQVLTDRDSVERMPDHVRELVLDYLAVGLDPEHSSTSIFCHSHVPALNQLLVPFLTLVGMGELERNPTVKEEITAAGLTHVSAAMYAYPVHQAADILFCKGNVVPVGKDQLPHLELTRKIARRFNQRFCDANSPVFPEPAALLSSAPKILGVDGGQKMSKSRNNAIELRATADETAALIKKGEDRCRTPYCLRPRWATRSRQPRAPHRSLYRPAARYRGHPDWRRWKRSAQENADRSAQRTARPDTGATSGVGGRRQGGTPPHA